MKKMILELEMPDDFEIGKCSACPFHRGSDQCIITDRMTGGSCSLNIFCALKDISVLEKRIKDRVKYDCIKTVKQYALDAYNWDMNEKTDVGKIGYIETGLYEAVEVLENMKG